MKIKVKKKNSLEGFLIELPKQSDLKSILPGDVFTVLTYEKENSVCEKKEACFLAEKNHLLIDNHVIEIKNPMDLCQQIEFEIIRNVQPIKRHKKLSGGDILSPMTGKIISISTSLNASVKSGDVLMVIEAMKMENLILAPCDGMISNLRVEKGKTVSIGDLLYSISPQEK